MNRPCKDAQIFQTSGIRKPAVEATHNTNEPSHTTSDHLIKPTPYRARGMGKIKKAKFCTSVSGEEHHHFKVTSLKICYSFNTILTMIICRTLLLHTREMTLFCLNKSKLRQQSYSSFTAFEMFSTNQVSILC